MLLVGGTLIYLKVHWSTVSEIKARLRKTNISIPSCVDPRFYAGKWNHLHISMITSRRNDTGETKDKWEVGERWGYRSEYSQGIWNICLNDNVYETYHDAMNICQLDERSVSVYLKKQTKPNRENTLLPPSNSFWLLFTLVPHFSQISHVNICLHLLLSCPLQSTLPAPPLHWNGSRTFHVTSESTSTKGTFHS